MIKNTLQTTLGLTILLAFIGVGVFFSIKAGWGDVISEACRPRYTAGQAKLDSVEADKRTRRRGSTFFLPKLTYSFEAQGRRYTGNTVGEHARNINTLRRAGPEGILGDFKVGQAFTVMYDPSDPTNSYIIVPGQKNDPMAWMPMAFMVVWTSFFVVVLLRSLPSMIKARRTS